MEMDSKIVIKPGSEVQIGPADHPIEAMVTQVTIASHKESYLVVWYNGGSRYEEWLDPIEIRTKEGGEPNRLRIGFK
jgi:hypothetical protein